jgi:hypothetical protein
MTSKSEKTVYERVRHGKIMEERRLHQVLQPWMEMRYPQVFAEFMVFFNKLQDRNPRSKNLTTSADFKRFRLNGILNGIGRHYVFVLCFLYPAYFMYCNFIDFTPIPMPVQSFPIESPQRAFTAPPMAVQPFPIEAPQQLLTAPPMPVQPFPIEAPQPTMSEPEPPAEPLQLSFTVPPDTMPMTVDPTVNKSEPLSHEPHTSEHVNPKGYESMSDSLVYINHKIDELDGGIPD